MAKKKSRPTPVPPEPLAELFDSHTHLWTTVQKMRGHQDNSLDSEEYLAAVKEIMDRAEAVGVRQICTIGDAIEETERAVEAAHADPRIWAAAAVHPTLAHTVDDTVKAKLTQMSRDPRVVAIGETGMDTYWIGKGIQDRDDADNSSAAPPLEVQEEAFRWHIDLAVESGKALMIHNREADKEILAVLDDAPKPPHVIFHCFSSPLSVAKEALDRGYILSFSGNVSFKRNVELREAARIAPPEQVLIETDAPFMTPEPFRGARNEPAYVGYTARVLAEVRGMDAEELGALTADNAKRVFGI